MGICSALVASPRILLCLCLGGGAVVLWALMHRLALARNLTELAGIGLLGTCGHVGVCNRRVLGLACRAVAAMLLTRTAADAQQPFNSNS